MQLAIPKVRNSGWVRSAMFFIAPRNGKGLKNLLNTWRVYFYKSNYKLPHKTKSLNTSSELIKQEP